MERGDSNSRRASQNGVNRGVPRPKHQRETSCVLDSRSRRRLAYGKSIHRKTREVKPFPNSSLAPEMSQRHTGRQLNFPADSTSPVIERRSSVNRRVPRGNLGCSTTTPNTYAADVRRGQLCRRLSELALKKGSHWLVGDALRSPVRLVRSVVSLPPVCSHILTPSATASDQIYRAL